MRCGKSCSHTQEARSSGRSLFGIRSAVIGFTAIRFTIRGDAASLLDWQTMLASLAYTFGYVGWVLTILNIVLGFLLAGTRPKVRYDARMAR